MVDERELAINPIIPDSVQHNARTISNIRNLTASLFGAVAGTLGLESYPGFLFYLVGTTIVSALVLVLRADGDPKRYFYSPFGDLWMGDLISGLLSFILTWTVFYGLVRA